MPPVKGSEIRSRSDGDTNTGGLGRKDAHSHPPNAASAHGRPAARCSQPAAVIVDEIMHRRHQARRSRSRSSD
jgi:hypothetical protein